MIFASEIKALFEARELPRAIDPEALSQYLTFGFVMPPLTLFSGVNKLAPGEALLVEQGGEPVRFSFAAPGAATADAARIRAAAYPEQVSRVREMLQASVEAMMVADVPVGAFLSGGVDSSTVVALMTRLSGRALDTVTVSHPDRPDLDEWPDAERFARGLGARAHKVEVSERDAIAALPDLAWHFDEPISDPAALNTFFAARSLREAGVVVALVGEGADEVFLGYPNYLKYHRLAEALRFRGRLPPGVLRAGEYLGQAVLTAIGAEVHRGTLRRAASGGPLFLGTETFFDDAEKGALSSAKLARYPSALTAARVQAETPAYMRDDPMSVFALAEIRMRMAEKLLMRVDKMSSAHSLEIRSPFLDAGLVDYVLALPSNVRAAGGETKRLLKDAVAPWVPPEVTGRRKQGFATPVAAWLRGEMGRYLEDRVANAGLFRDGVLERPAVLDLLAAHRAGGRSARNTHTRLWNILMLAEWYDRFGVRGVACGGAGQRAAA